MRVQKFLIVLCVILFTLAFGGCNTTNKTRPAPTRHKITAPTKKVRPAPTKRTPGLATMTDKQIADRISKIETAVKSGNWSAATRETDTLGIDMTKFRPAAAKGKSLREMTSFSALYTRLQADIRMKNKTGAMNDLKRFKEQLPTVSKTSTPSGPSTSPRKAS